MPELMAEEAVKDAAPVDQAKDVCEDIVKAKEMCLAEVRSKEKLILSTISLLSGR